MDFTLDLPVRIVFGTGRRGDLAAELEQLGITRPMLCCTPGGAARYAELGALCAGIFARAEPHCPEPVAMAALDAFRKLNADGVVSVGGGSTIGLGKVIAAETGAPSLVLPTTYSGSELTPLYGMLVGDEKRTKRDERCLAKTVIYDPDLTLSLSPHLTATSGMNGLAHCVEALYPQTPHPVAALYAEAGVAAFAHGLPASVANPDDTEARTRALYGAMLGGAVVTLVGIAIHHKICHVLGGRHGIPHGESNAVMLPHAVAYNRDHAPEAMAALKRALNTDNPAGALWDLAHDMGAPTALKDLGMAEADLDAAAELSVRATAWNPRPPDVASVRAMLDDAFFGRRPGR